VDAVVAVVAVALAAAELAGTTMAAGPRFKDLFSKQAGAYARFRPKYPPGLFEFLATLTPMHELVWDCGTGNGQAAVDLAGTFSRVIATDPAQAQIDHATTHPRVQYLVAPAESAPMIRDRSVDLVTVATAVHWFRHDEFYSEVRRVLKPEGAIAVWSYRDHKVNPIVDEVCRRYDREFLKPYWAPEIPRYVHQGYRTLPFPFEEIPTPSLSLETEWDLETLRGYLSSWSAAQKYREANGKDPMEEFGPILEAAWGDPSIKREVSWDLILRAGRVP
jgi:SAM-dependent methyltransferase